MKTAAIISSLGLGLTALAAPAPQTTTTTPKYFGGVAIRSGSPIHFASVSASDTSFYLGRDTSTYCPSEVVDPCPVQNYTVFAGGDSTLSLDVEVPGGQQVYVDAAGALRFTAPHSANTGTGSSVSGFSFADSGLHLQFNGVDFLACPVDETSYQVYAGSAVQNSTTCLGFSFRVSENANATAAWEYA